MAARSELRALVLAAVLALSVSVALVGPLPADAAVAGNHSTATPAPRGPSPDAPANTTPRNGTARNETGRNRSVQSIERGPRHRAHRRRDAPRVSADVIVDDDGKADYRSVAVAASNATPGETIVVRPGTYDGGVTVAVDGLTVVGFGPERTTLDGVGVSVVNASNVTVRGFALGGASTGVAVDGSENVTLADLRVEGAAGDAVAIGSVVGLSIDDVEVSSADVGVNVSATGDVTDVRIAGSEVEDAGTGLRVGTDGGSIANLTVTGNKIEESDRGVVVAPGDARAVSITDTDFVDNVVGALVREGADVPSLALRRNSFVDNEVGIRSEAADTVDAERNAWGALSGPATDGNPGGRGDAVRGDVDFDPWIPTVVRLEQARVVDGRLVVDLVAHSNRLAGYEAIVRFTPSAVDDVDVAAEALPAEASVDGGHVTIRGAGDHPVTGPAVLAELSVAGDASTVARDLRLQSARSSARAADGEARSVVFLTADLAVAENGSADPTPTPTPVPTATPTPEATETSTPRPTARPTEQAPQEVPTGTPTAAPATAADRSSGTAAPATATEGTPAGGVLGWPPDGLPSESVLSRLVGFLRSVLAA